jgi:hypothetical protein
MSTTSFIISIQYVIIMCNDVTRASLNKDGQNLLTTMDRRGLFITQVYALKSGAWLCGQKFKQDFSFKIHLLLQNVLH